MTKEQLAKYNEISKELFELRVKTELFTGTFKPHTPEREVLDAHVKAALREVQDHLNAL